MNFRSSFLFPIGLALTSFCQAASTYQENFTNATSGNISHTAVGWSSHYGTSATDGSGNTTNNAGGGFVVSNISSGYGAKTTFSNTYGLAYTTEVLANTIATADITGISFLARNQTATDRFRVVVAIDVAGSTQWYASDTFFTTTAGAWADGAQAQNLPFTTAASSWRALTFTQGSALSLSDTTLGAALPSGNLMAAGLFMSGNTATAGSSGGTHLGTMRYDNFTVTVVPEPSTAALGALAICFCGFSRKRRH